MSVEGQRSEKSLKGLKVLVTRPSGEQTDIISQIARLGGDVVSAPVLQVKYRLTEDVRESLEELSTYDAVVLTSANSMRALQAASVHFGLPLTGYPRWLAISSRTAIAVQNAGLSSEVYPGVKTSGQFAAAIVQDFASRGRARFLFAHGQLTNRRLPEVLEGEGHQVTTCICYDTVEAVLPKKAWEEYLGKEPVIVLLYSPSAAQSLVRQAGLELLTSEQVYIVTIGPTTSGACNSLGLRVHREARQPNDESVLDALLTVV